MKRKKVWPWHAHVFLVDQCYFSLSLLIVGFKSNMASKEIEGYLNTTLVQSIRKRNTRILKQILKKGADVNLKSDGKTPLCLATEIGNVEVVRLLLDAGADVKDSMSDAVEKGHHEILRTLLKAGVDVNKVEYSCLDGLTKPLFRVTELGHVKCLEVLINGGGDANVFVDYDQRNALMLAAMLGHSSCLNLLLKAGADVNILSRGSERTALRLAAGSGRLECVKSLIEAGADVNIISDHGDTALMAGADVNAKSKILIDLYYDSVFQLNQNDDYKKVCKKMKILLDAGARVNNVGSWKRIIDEVDFRHRYRQRELSIRIDYEFAKKEQQKQMRLMFAAGEKSLHHYLELKIEVNLSLLCRDVIREHLMELDQHENLFVRVPRLGLPTALQSYLVFDETTDVTAEEEESCLHFLW